MSEETKVIEFNPDDLEKISGGAGTRPTGMPCPNCNGFMPISMQQIIVEPVITCPHCGLRLIINRQDSQSAIEALKNFKAMQREQMQKNQH